MEINGRGQLQLWEVLLALSTAYGFRPFCHCLQVCLVGTARCQGCGGEGAPAAAQHVLR